MAWDTEGTRRKLLEAGSRQFAATGLAATRLDAVAADAGVNKERVYRYFGDKRSFFAAVLAHELTALLADLRVEEPTAEGVADFAGRLFDRCARRPDLPRLLAWESLELADPVAREERAPLCAANAAHVAAALPGIDRESAEHLLLSVLDLVVSWWTLGRLGEVVLTGSPGADPARRRAVVDQVTVLARGLGAAAGPLA